jgi:hypothetical protein
MSLPIPSHTTHTLRLAYHIVCVCVCVYIYIYIYMYIYIYVYTAGEVGEPRPILFFFVCRTHSEKKACESWISCKTEVNSSIYIYMYICMYIYDIYIHTYIYMCVYTYVYL